MSYAKAGRYNQALLRKTTTGSSRLLVLTPVIIRLTDDTTLATLYLNEAKSATVANPVVTDSDGNLEFFANPGFYKGYPVVSGVEQEPFDIEVGINPNETLGAVASVNGRTGTVTGLAEAADLAAESAARSTGDGLAVPLTQKGAVNGVATLDGSGTVPDAQIPASIARDSEVTAAVNAAVNALVAGAPGALDTLKELADAVNDDASFAATVTAALAAKAPLSSPTFTGVAAAPAFSVSGLTGSVQASRYVGATAGGAPTTGAHLIGDWVIDRTGHIWICTAAGTPGTWVDPSASATSAPGLNLAPTAVKTANYTAAASDLVLCNTSGGAFTVTLPTAPADKTTVGVKLVTAGNTLNLALGGSDVFNKTGGPTTGSLSLLNQAIVVQYQASSAIWYVVTDDLPLSALDTRYAPWDVIAEAVVSSAVATIDFTSIPATYRHLRLVGSPLKGDTGAAQQATLWMRINNDSGTNYLNAEIKNNSGTLTAAGTNDAQALAGYIVDAGAQRATEVGYTDITVFNYRETAFGKRYSSRGGAFYNAGTGVLMGVDEGIWLSTAAINRLTLLIASGVNFTPGCYVTLYGMKGLT